MREIIFKARSLNETDYKGEKLWYEGGLVPHLPYTPCPIPSPGSVEEDEKNTKYYIFSEGFSDWNMPRDLEQHEVEKETICQYTGTRVPVIEKGKKFPYKTRLWENDIVIVQTKDGEKEGIVVWDQDISAFIIKTCDGENLSLVSDVSEITKCGNVFDDEFKDKYQWK